MKTKNKEDITSAFHDLVGFQLVEWQLDYAVLELDIRDQHLNRSGVLHGGVLTTLIDTVCGFAGCYSTAEGEKRKAVTLSLTTSFTGQVNSGKVRAVGRKRSSGRRIYIATAEIFSDTGELIALGETTNRYRTAG